MKKSYGKRLLASCAIVGLLSGQVLAASLLPNGEQTFVDLNGQPLAAGTVGFYVPNTLTSKTTWRDAGATTPNANPVVLDAAGRAIIYGSGTYRQIVKDVFGNVIWDQLTNGEGGGNGTITTTPTIATLRAISAASGPGIGNILVQDYYGTGFGCPIQYAWNASDSSADNGGAIINPTGNAGAGRWNLNLSPKSPVHSCVFGVKVDSTVGGGGGQDNTTQLQALLNWAGGVTGPNYVHIDGKQGFCVRITGTLTPGPGMIIEGDGQGQVAGSTITGTCINSISFSGWVFQYQTPYPGFGTVPAESPKFRDLTVDIRNGPNTAAGGCFQLNSIAGGFTDDNTSQQYMMHPEFTNVVCNMGFLNNVTQIGIQCSKCADGTFSNVVVNFGATGIDLEGSENIKLAGGRISQTFGPMVKFVQHGTFGNNNTLDQYQLLSFMNFGQSVDSYVLDTARASVISNNLFENFGLPDANIGAAIHLSSGFTVDIHGNDLGIFSTYPWLKVDTTYQNITAIGNGGSATIVGRPVFSNSASWYNSASKQILVHYGNAPGGDAGWPYNTKQQEEQFLFPKVRAIWTPSGGSNPAGLQYAGYGPSEKPAGNHYLLPTTGGADYLLFIPESEYFITGTFDVAVFAWQSSGAGQITCQLQDNGTPVGAATAQAVTSTPTWYTIALNQAIATEAWVSCWNTGTGTGGNPLVIGQINLVDH